MVALVCPAARPISFSRAVHIIFKYNSLSTKHTTTTKKKKQLSTLPSQTHSSPASGGDPSSKYLIKDSTLIYSSVNIGLTPQTSYPKA